jgi:hypothetical protein
MAIALLLMTQVYRPGIGFDQELLPGSYTLNSVRILTETIHTHLVQTPNPMAAFSVVFSFYDSLDLALSRTSSIGQFPLRREFLRELCKDFIENSLKKKIMQNTYDRLHLLDPFVLMSIVRHLFLCSGYYLHTMQIPAGAAGARPSASFLPLRLSEYSRQDLDNMYEYVVKTCFILEKKQNAVSIVNRMLRRVSLNDGSVEDFVVHSRRGHDLVKSLEYAHKQVHPSKTEKEEEKEEDGVDDDGSSAVVLARDAQAKETS